MGDYLGVHVLFKVFITGHVDVGVRTCWCGIGSNHLYVKVIISSYRSN